MAMKSLLFVHLLVAAMATPIAEAQLLPGLLSLIRIQGTLFCSINGTTGANGTATPVFPNATVQLQCGSGNVVSTGITNAQGIFVILLNPVQFILSTLLSNCSLVVTTPLANCNATLPSGGILRAPLQFVGNTFIGLLRIINVIPGLFTFIFS